MTGQKESEKKKKWKKFEFAFFHLELIVGWDFFIADLKVFRFCMFVTKFCNKLGLILNKTGTDRPVSRLL